MNTYTPLWSQIVDSTLWEEEPYVRVTFLTMLATKDPDHVVRMPLRRLVKKVNLPVEQVLEALKILAAPDDKSLDYQNDEGRRIREVEGGWLMINGQHYQDEMLKLMTRLRKTAWQRQHREAQREEPARRKAVEKLMRPGGARTMEERLIEKAEREGDDKTIAALDRMSPHQRQAKATADEFVAKFQKSMEAANAALAAASPEDSPIDPSALTAETAPAEGSEGQSFPEV